MKKVLLLLVLALSLAACGDKKEETEQKPELFAENLITAEKAEELLASEIVKSTDKNKNCSVVEYYPEKIGSVPPIIVELYSPGDEKSTAVVNGDFNSRKQMRPSAKKVDGIGSDAYIAYPSLVFYRDGYMVVVTAGTGGEKAEDILMQTAKIADEKLQEYLNDNPVNNDLLEE